MKLPLILALAALFGTSAHAGLIGTDATVNYYFDLQSSSDVVTVSNGVEVTCPGGFNICNILIADNQAIDIGDYAITYTYTGPGAVFNNTTPNMFDFQGLNPGSPIVGVLLSTDIVGLNSSRLSFTADSVQLTMSSLALSGPQSGFTLQLITAAQVPEPSAFSFAGLGGLAFVALKVVRARTRR